MTSDNTKALLKPMEAEPDYRDVEFKEIMEYYQP